MFWSETCILTVISDGLRFFFRLSSQGIKDMFSSSGGFVEEVVKFMNLFVSLQYDTDEYER